MKKIQKFILFFLSFLTIISSSSISVYAGNPIVPNKFYVAVGGSLTIPTDLSNCKGKNKKWTTNSGNISITTNGTVTGKSQGTGSAVCATNMGETATCSIIVVPAAKLSINKTSASLNSGGSVKLSVSISPSNAIKNVEWSSSNTNIATVDSSGNVKAKNKNGSCTIYCTSQDGTNTRVSCSVSVKVPPTTQAPNTTKQQTTKRHNNTTTKPNTTKAPQKTTSGNNNTNAGGYSRGPEISTSGSNNNTPSNNQPTTEEVTTATYTRGEEITETPTEITSNNITVTYNDDETTELSDESIYSISAVSKKKSPIIVQWKEIENVSGYELYCKEPGNETFEVIYVGTETSYEKHLYENGKPYLFMIRYYVIENNKKRYGENSEIIGIKAVNKSLFEQLLDKFS